MMWKFLRGGATVIPGATFIPESRVPRCYLKDYIGDHVLLNETERLRYIKNA